MTNLAEVLELKKGQKFRIGDNVFTLEIFKVTWRMDNFAEGKQEFIAQIEFTRPIE